MLEINDKINRFVDNLFTFKRDIELTAVSINAPQKKEMKMAAEGLLGSVNTKVKIGWLTDSSNEVLARVFYNRKREEYQLFFFPEKNQTLNNCVLVISNSNVFFIIDEAERAVIPKSMNINPIEDDMFISIPDGLVTLTKKGLDEEHEIICKNSSNIKFLTKFNENDKSLVFSFHSDIEETIVFSKMILTFQTQKDGKINCSLLIPIVDQTAKVSSFDMIPERFTIAFFG